MKRLWEKEGKKQVTEESQRDGDDSTCDEASSRRPFDVFFMCLGYWWTMGGAGGGAWS